MSSFKNRLLSLRGMLTQVVPGVLAAGVLSACAAQTMAPHTEAWDLVDEPTAQENTTRTVPASASVVHTREATWLDPYANADYYAQTPTAQAVAARRAEQAPMSSPEPVGNKQMGVQDPRGWSHNQLVASWGIPARIEGSQWIYEEKDAQGRCARSVSLRMDDGVVARTAPARCAE